MDTSSKREYMKIIKRKTTPKGQSMDILREIKKTKQDKYLYRENSNSLRSSII